MALGQNYMNIDLLADFFESLNVLFIFYGSLNLYHIYDQYDIDHFDFHSFIFASSYLMINDCFLALL